MSAVGLTDVYRYGTKFLGALLVVAGVGGGLIAAGYVLVQNGSFNALSANAGYRAVLGIVVGTLGGLLLVSGVIGLAHKLVADATMAGALAARSTRHNAGSGVTADERAAAAGGGTADSPQSPTDEGTDAEPAPSDGSEPAAAETDDAPAEATAGSGVRVATPADDAATPLATDEEAPASETTTAATAAEGGAPSQAEAQADTSDGQIAPSDFVTEAEMAAEEPEDDQSDSGPSEEPPPAESDPHTEPQEWTPPDPAEFDGADGESADEPASVSEATTADDWGQTPESDAGDGTEDAVDDGMSQPDPATEETRLLDESTESTSTTGPRTTDDLFGSDEGPQTDADGDGLFDSGEGERAGTEGDGPDGEQTAADEDVSAIDVAGDEDPLSDALEDE